MKVACYYNNSDIRIEERPVPSIGSGEILVRMLACGICGTDVMEWYRIKKAPRILGHEMAGEVVEAGEGVVQFRKGDRVFVSHHVPCYKCRYCKDGHYTACEALHYGNYDPGGFSEYIRVPRENVEYGTFLLPDGITCEDAVMVEPLACVVLGQKHLDIKKGHTVLIIGSGVSGLLHIRLAKLCGATVIATDINKFRMEKALESGADHVLHASDYSAERLSELNQGRLADCVIVCAGANQAVEHALSSVQRRGRILFFAVPNEDIRLPSVTFWRNEITVAFSYGASPDELRKALDLISKNSISVRDMVTERVLLSDIQKGFRLVSEGGESLKVAVVPDDK